MARDSAAHAAYHGPRTPPTSIAPPPAESSFSVASEYDPKAPTKPKVRRNTSVPPAPLLFGMDRMLVWGLVLGGTFVAAIVVIVHQLTSLDTRGPYRGNASPPQPVHDVSGPEGPTTTSPTSRKDETAPIGSLGQPHGASQFDNAGSPADSGAPLSTMKSAPKVRARKAPSDTQDKHVPWIE
ncbi:MAG TPA: hypothetical protein VIV60_19440 [Polyangiaceae bacterium]